MNTIKDTQKTNTDSKELVDKGLNYVFNTLPQTNSKTLADKAQKIGTAVYMITELFSADELSNHIRQKSLGLIKALFSNLSGKENKMSLKAAQHHMYEMISYVDIAYHAGFVSKMNYMVLVEKAKELQKSIINEEDSTTNDDANPIYLAKFFIENEKNTESLFTEELKDIALGKDSLEIAKPKEQPIKKIAIKTTTRSTENVSYSNTKKTNQKQSKSDKRHEDILTIMKQKKNASINDICALIKNCSSKTIQRDLNELIKTGTVVKRGDRRWSVYNLR